MLEPRFLVKRAFQKGAQAFRPGTRVNLEQVFPLLPTLLSLGAIEDLGLPQESVFVCMLRGAFGFEDGEIVAKVDCPDWKAFVKRGWAIEVYDKELCLQQPCPSCHKAFMTWAALAKHKGKTGHKRPRRKVKA